MMVAAVEHDSGMVLGHGVGLRAGANIGYLHYGRKHLWIPF